MATAEPSLLSAADGAKRTQTDAARPARAFALLGTVQATLVFTITLIAVPLPAIGREFSLGPSGLVMVSTAYGLAFSGLLLFGGRLADRRGGRALFAAGLVIFAVASAAAAAAPGFAVLVVARFAEGAGAALVAPAAMAVVRAVIPDEGEHARALATWGGPHRGPGAAGNRRGRADLAHHRSGRGPACRRDRRVRLGSGRRRPGFRAPGRADSRRNAAQAPG